MGTFRDFKGFYDILKDFKGFSEIWVRKDFRYKQNFGVEIILGPIELLVQKFWSRIVLGFSLSQAEQYFLSESDRTFGNPCVPGYTHAHSLCAWL